MTRLRNAYECSRCGNMMKKEERTACRTTLTGAVVTATYREDLCPSCATKAVSGQLERLQPVRLRGGKVLILPDTLKLPSAGEPDGSA